MASRNEVDVIDIRANDAAAPRGSGASSAFSIPGLPVDSRSAVPEGHAPLIRDCWYVIARSDLVDRELRAIKVLGEPLVYFRSEAGDPVVLDDRCAHRRFSLSKSKLIGDVIECGYHGFRFEKTGRCSFAPGLSSQPQFGVRAYPCAERGPWLWAWMGDPALADPADIPFEERGDETPHGVGGYKLNPGNYMLLIENLLDLTHLHFLHGADVSSEEFTATAPKSIEVAGGVGYAKIVTPDIAGPVAEWCGGDPAAPIRHESDVRQIGPSLNDQMSIRTAVDPAGPASLPQRVRFSHGVTPLDEHNTHQFWHFALSEPIVLDLAQIRHRIEDVIFEQDVTAIRSMEEAIVEDRRTGTIEFGVASDRFGIRMRKILRDRALQKS